MFLIAARLGCRPLDTFERPVGARFYPDEEVLGKQMFTAGGLTNPTLDPELALADVQTMREKLSASVAWPRYWVTQVSVFAGVGVVLAAVGIYGVLSYFVSRQQRDIGIRLAMGAEPSSVLRMMVGRGMVQAGRSGLAGALLRTRSLEGLLFQVSPTDLRRRSHPCHFFSSPWRWRPGMGRHTGRRRSIRFESSRKNKPRRTSAASGRGR